MSDRAAYIRANYSLEQTATGWRAVSLYQGRVFSEIVAASRETVTHNARCRWGHFNYSDECRAFDEIFR